jgi:hypothetical protein
MSDSYLRLGHKWNIRFPSVKESTIVCMFNVILNGNEHCYSDYPPSITSGFGLLTLDTYFIFMRPMCITRYGQLTQGLKVKLYRYS